MVPQIPASNAAVAMTALCKDCHVTVTPGSPRRPGLAGIRSLPKMKPGAPVLSVLGVQCIQKRLHVGRDRGLEAEHFPGAGVLKAKPRGVQRLTGEIQQQAARGCSD